MAFARVLGMVIGDYVAALRDPSRSPRTPGTSLFNGFQDRRNRRRSLRKRGQKGDAFLPSQSRPQAVLERI